MKVIDSMWFNTIQGVFGFVVGENERGERKLYAGVVPGFSQKDDEQAILSWGNKVNIGMMEGLIAKTKMKPKGKIHFLDPSMPEDIPAPLCTVRVRLSVTKNPEEVTCGSCLRMLERQKKGKSV